MASRKHLGGPFWHLGSTLGGNFDTWGPPWRTTGAAGWTRSCPSQDLSRFWSDFGTGFSQFLAFKMHKISFHFQIYFQVIFYRSLTRIPDVWDFKIVVFAWNVLQNSIVHGNRFQRISGLFLIFFRCLGSRFSDFFRP